jgi:ParB-like nuclease domain
MKQLKLSEIRIDGGTQVRLQMDPTWISEIVDNMRNDVEYPPLETIYDGENHWLTDGFHRYYALKQLGVKSYNVDWIPGTLQEAIVRSLSANSKHGKPRTREDKINAVVRAREMEQYKEASNYEIAKVCAVSQSFVAAVLDPKVKARQDAARQKSIEKKVAEKANTSPTSIEEPAVPAPAEGMEPSEEELAANEAALQADIETMQKLLVADDKLAEAYKIIEAQNLRIAQQDLRMKGLMNEKNEAIKMVKDLQKQLDKIKGQ